MKTIRELLRLIIIGLKYFIYAKVYRMNIDRSSRISVGAKLDKTNPKGIHIGQYSYIASGAIIFTHDYSRTLYLDTYIGNYCFIGANAIVMPGVVIGNHVIIGSGAVVTKDIPSNSIAVGNPARVIKSNIQTKKFGKISTEQ